MITQVTYNNFKGKSGSQELTGLDLFIGLNGSGKSSVLQIPALTMLGYVPGNGKEESATFKLSSSESEMAVGIKTDSGFSCQRRFKKSRETVRKTGESKIKITQELSVSPSKGEKTQGDFKERIAVEVGNFAAMFDISEFLSLSGPKRREFIDNLAPIQTEEWDKGKIHARLEKALLIDELAKNNLDQLAIMKGCIDEVMSKYPDGYTVSDGLTAMIGWLAEEKKFWKKRAEDTQGAVRQISEMKNQEAETERDLVKCKAEKESLTSELIKLKEKIAAGTEKQKALDDRNKRISELNGLIESLLNAEVSTETFDLDVQIEELTGKLDTTDYSAKIDELKKKGTKTKTFAENLKIVYDGLKEKKINFEAQYNSLKSSLKTVDGCKGGCVVDPARISCPKDFNQFKEFVAQKSAEAEKFISTIQGEMEKADSRYQEAVKECLNIQTEIENLLDQSRKANETNRQINEQLAKLQEQRNERQNAVKNRDIQVSFYRKELAQLNSQSMAASAPVEVASLEEEAGKKETRITELTSTIEAKEKAKRDMVLVQQAILDNRQAEYKSACYKSIDEELGPKGIQGEIVKGALGPLQKNMQEYLKIMGFNNQVWFETESETGQEVFEFGWLDEKGRRVYFDTLSCGQQIIYLAALMTVIIDRANPHTRILSIDRLDDLDKYNFELALSGLSKLKSKFDNICLAGDVKGELVFPEGWEKLSRFTVDGFTVWNLTPEGGNVNANDLKSA